MKQELYPLAFREMFLEKPWGGDGLRKHLGKAAGRMTGESWEVADFQEHSSVIANGACRGKTLGWLLSRAAREVLGEDVYIRHKRFPLLAKFLWAQDRLSLQVHPSDEFARAFEADGHQGKMEAWYVVAAGPEARVIRGILPGTTEAEFRDLLGAGRVEECVNRLRVKEGDVIFIPPGTIHSAYGGLLVFEIQQASDLTYRLTDWGRGGSRRKVDPERAIKAMDLGSIGVSKLKPTLLGSSPYRRKLLLKCEKFTLEMMETSGAGLIKEKTDPDRFKLLTVLEGRGSLSYGPGLKKAEPFDRGRTILLPAFLGEFALRPSGKCRILVSTT